MWYRKRMEEEAEKRIAQKYGVVFFPAIAGLISLLIVMTICKTIYGGWGTDKEIGDNTRTENKTDETQIAVNEEQHTDNKEQDTKESQIENSDYKSYIEENNDILEEKEYSQSVEMELPTFLLVEPDRIDEVKPGKTYLYYDGSEYVFANIVYDMDYSRITLHFIVEEDGELVKYKDVFYFDNSEDNPLEYGDDYGNRIVVKSEKSFMIILNGYDYSDEIYKLADDEDIAECQKHLETIVANTCEYILPESDSRYISYDDLRGLTADECRIARNELYASITVIY